MHATVRDNDYVLGECDLDALRSLVLDLEARHDIAIVKEPTVCLTMIRAEDSLDRQEFYLGEALTTDCEVTVDRQAGYGLCLGDEPVRGYCLAVLDALLHGGAPADPAVGRFIERQRELIATREAEEFNLILRTHVDFKLMEEE
jgi:phosphonate C-P lyase system protein PhnG